MWSIDPWALSASEAAYVLSAGVGLACAIWALELAMSGRMRFAGAVVLLVVAFVPYVGGVACVVALLWRLLASTRTRRGADQSAERRRTCVAR